MSARDDILSRLRAGTTIRRATPAPAATPATTLPVDRATMIRIFAERAQQSGAIVHSLESDDTLKEALSGLEADNDSTLVYADAGIAETGTLCFHSHGVTSRSLFLCEHLLAAVAADDIVAYQEDYWERLRTVTPRAVHFVTGPSRTADVEQTIQIGAHGPRAVTIYIIG